MADSSGNNDGVPFTDRGIDDSLDFTSCAKQQFKLKLHKYLKKLYLIK